MDNTGKITEELENINSIMCDVYNALPNDFTTDTRSIEKKLDRIIDLMEKQVHLSDDILNTLNQR